MKQLQMCFALLGLVGMTGCMGSGMRMPGPTRHLSGSPPSTHMELPSSQYKAPGLKKQRSTRDAKRIAKGAGAWVGKSRLRHNGTTFRYDCSGFVNAAHALAGEDLAHRNAAGMVKYAKSLGLYKRMGSPGVGDTVFWDNTHDRNKNGKWDDDFTHVGIVERVDSDGTLHVVHLGGKGVVRIRMNLRRPDEYKNGDGKVLNSYLRRRTKKDKKHVKYLSGQLYSGMASFWAEGKLASR